MPVTNFLPLAAEIEKMSIATRVGHVSQTFSNSIQVKGLSDLARVGDLVELKSKNGICYGEVLSLTRNHIVVLPETGAIGFALNDPVHYLGSSTITPDRSWLGRIIDPFARPLDNRPIMSGASEMPLLTQAPAAVTRKRLGERLETGLAVFNSFLPIVRGQRIGLFAGSGVGKSTLLSELAKGVSADVVVIALIGERGRELRDFVEDVLGVEGLKKSVIVAATSDQSPMARRRAGWTAMAVAEFFRDQGQHVLFLADSLTRFAEAHREIATSGGEAGSLRGFPPSTSQTLMGLCERAGPGPEGAGDITGIFSVLVSGSDMEEPVADMVRGVLDGHVILDRKIAERGRFPAIDLLRSVSRSLPAAATGTENKLLGDARYLMSIYSEAEIMIQAGLYSEGANRDLDMAIAVRPRLEAFLSAKGLKIEDSFSRLSDSLCCDQVETT